jgi:hypothetical protein
MSTHQNSEERVVAQRQSAKEVVPRKKACEHCAKTKVRCDQRRPVCTRCVKRRITCVYSAPSSNPAHQFVDIRAYNTGAALMGDGSLVYNSPPLSQDAGFTEPSPATAPSIDTGVGTISLDPMLEHILNHGSSQKPERNPYWDGSPVNFTDLQLICTIDTTKVRDRWLADFVPTLNDRAKVHPPAIIAFVDRVFKTFPRKLLRKGQLPPYMHPAQFAGPDIPTALANLLSLSRLWDGQVRGGEAIVRDTVKNEMERLYREVCMIQPL